MIIAIDGPAGSGKSTVAKRVAERLGILYVDTGAMYRALTHKAMEKGLDLKDEAALINMAKDTEIELVLDKNNKLTVFLDGRDVSAHIRTPELTNNIRYVAPIPGVRREMVKMQRRAAREGKGAVLEGRDIGTVVFPDADKKFYLDADFQERVKRRHKELVEVGMNVDLINIKEDVERRDKSDMERKTAPLRRADDAAVIDTTKLSIEETVEKILSCL
ncbi:MAG: (d)CMP kinase [Candidatus Omnitrophica bacterium]|nr:(d)CMP kinase [Candidatus Omnitrophota bacterium]